MRGVSIIFGGNRIASESTVEVDDVIFIGGRIVNDWTSVPVVAIVFSLVLVAPSPTVFGDAPEPDDEGSLRVGIATTDITPPLGYPMSGYFMQLGQETAVVGLPGEVFVELGLAIKQASPYRYTLVIELANSDESGYIPTRLAYQGGGYEVINSVFQPGGGEALVETSIELLRAMKMK